MNQLYSNKEWITSKAIYLADVLSLNYIVGIVQLQLVYPRCQQALNIIGNIFSAHYNNWIARAAND